MDSNMRHLPSGTEFFAKVYGCKEGTNLHLSGVRKGDLLRCIMVSDESNDPEVLYVLLSGKMISNIGESFGDNWLVYEGCIDGTDYLNDERRDYALNKLKEYP